MNLTRGFLAAAELPDSLATRRPELNLIRSPSPEALDSAQPAGAIILQVANLIRVVTLYLVGCYHRTWFETFHLGIWQSLMFGIAVAFFVLWSRRTKLVHVP